jgi:hypothetical protein
MMKLFSLLFVSFLPFPFAEATPRIVGGSDSKQFPYFVQLRFFSPLGSFRCGGSLIYEDVGESSV